MFFFSTPLEKPSEDIEPVEDKGKPVTTSIYLFACTRFYTGLIWEEGGGGEFMFFEREKNR